jgi:hypothetical protein
VGSNQYRFGRLRLHHLINGFAITRIVAAGALVLAIRRWPYSYYSILRWTVCTVAVYGAVRAIRSGRQAWAWIFAAMAILFNPVAPIHFSRSDWRVVDVMAASLFLLSVLMPDAENRAAP